MLFIFDMGGVVTTTAGTDFFKSVADHLYIPLEDYFKFGGFGTDSSLFRQLDDGLITSREFWKIFSERSGLNVTCDWHRLLFHPVLNADVRSVILELRQNGHRVVCGTNTIDSHYDNHISRGDYALFDSTYASIHMGVSKPDARFWKLILDCEGVTAEETFFTDDKLENCKAAAKLGITAHHFTSAVALRSAIKDFVAMHTSVVV